MSETLDHPPKPNAWITHPTGIKFIFKDGKSLGHGKKGDAYLVSVHGGQHDGSDMVLKLPYLPSADKRGGIETFLRELVSDQALEIEATRGLQNESEVAVPLYFGKCECRCEVSEQNQVLQLPYTVSRYCPGPSLRTWLTAPNRKLPGFEEWALHTQKLFDTLGRVHRHRVVHADLHPDNIIFDGVVPKLIDFGQAWSLSKYFEKINKPKSITPYLAYERYNTPAGNWYTAAADLYSMGGVAYFLATGQDPPSPLKLSPGIPEPTEYDEGTHYAHLRGRELKRIIVRGLKDHNPGLYVEQPGVADVILMCMRPKLADRVRTTGEVVSTIDSLRPPAQDGIRAIQQELYALNLTFRTLKKTLQSKDTEWAANPVFQRIVLRYLRWLHDDVKTLPSRVFDLRGTRAEFVDGMAACVAALGPGDRLTAVTTTRFWRKANFGPYGRLTSMLMNAAIRGAKIRWQLLIPKSKRWPNKKNDEDILEYQKLVNTEYEESIGRIDSQGVYDVRFMEVEDREVTELRLARHTFVLFENFTSKWSTLAAAAFSDIDGPISNLRLWHAPDRLDKLLAVWEEWSQKDKSRPILEYSQPLAHDV